ncbi:hypothetical protein [Streptomyces sp. NPDC048442]|uniref:hypothetical protein n=1 Tax=Streptomyces sp. NPDC048442 TaxID=3154823 RepID=UPI00342DE140
MRITEHTLKEAWQQLAARSDLLDEAMLPPTGTSPDQYEQRADSSSELFLVLDEDGTVRGFHGPYLEVFATQDLDQALYFAAEEAVRVLAERDGAGVTGQAGMLERINPAWGARFRSGGTGDASDTQEVQRPCGGDPLERLAWIAGTWREQEPYTHLAFFRGDDLSAEEIALAHGADPEQVAAGTSLSELRGMAGDGRDEWDIAWESCCFGQVGEWAFLMYHELPPGTWLDSAGLGLFGVTETVELSATSAKAIYSFSYMRDGHRVDDNWGMLELIWYDRGRAPYYRGGQLDFLNRAVRRAELDHPELTGEFELYFHALETGLGLQLPRQAVQDGTVRAAQWADRAR